MCLFIGFWVCLFVVAFFESGCSVLPSFTKKPFKVTTLAGTAVTQSNDVKEPMKTETHTEQSTTVIPSGSDISFNEKIGVFTVHLAKDLSIVKHSLSENILAPLPNGKPSARDEALASAEGQARLWTYIVSGVMFLGASALLYIGHIKAGVFLILGAIGLPLLSFVVQILFAYIWVIICVSIAGALIWAWESVKHSHPAYAAELKEKLVKVENTISQTVAKV